MGEEKIDGIVALGNLELLLNRDKVAFMSSRRVAPDAVILCYDWAYMVRDEGTCVIGGFQSPLERDVLKILLKDRGGEVVMVLARKLWRKVPEEYREAIDDGRLLIVSPVSDSRVTAESAMARNRYILDNCTFAMFASIDPGGSLDRLLLEYPNLPHGVFADVR